MKIVWNKNFSVKVQLMDYQHEHFFEIINKIFGLVDQSKMNEEILMEVIKELENYANYHLTTEEELFKKFEYKEAKEHVRIHNLYREKMNEFMKIMNDKNSDKAILAQNVAQFVADWLINHIMTVDKRYTECFNKHGLK